MCDPQLTRGADLFAQNLAAIEQIAYHFSDALYDPRYGWAPKWRCRPTHVAVYVGAEEAKLKPLRDLSKDEYETYLESLADKAALYDDWAEYNDTLGIAYDATTGAAEWVPGCGPAPIWSHPTAALTMTRQEMASVLDAWIKERW